MKLIQVKKEDSVDSSNKQVSGSCKLREIFMKILMDRADKVPRCGSKLLRDFQTFDGESRFDRCRAEIEVLLVLVLKSTLE